MKPDQPTRNRRFLTPWGRRLSRRQVARVHVAVGIWLLVLTAILYAKGVGEAWAWILAVVAALHFALAYRALRQDAR